jgi:hypothetical protein
MTKVVAGSTPTRLAFLEPVAEGFQIVFLTTRILDSSTFTLRNCFVLSSALALLYVICVMPYLHNHSTQLV